MIKIISSIPQLAHALCDTLYGYGGLAHITEDCNSYEFKVDVSLTNKIDYILTIQDLLKPFNFSHISFVKLDNDIDMEISLGADDMELLPVQIFAHSQEKVDLVHQRISDAGCGLCRSGIRSFDRPMVIHGVKEKNSFIPHYVAWCAGMPKETVYEYDPEQVGETTALCVPENPYKFKRKIKPITIRCSNESVGSHLQNYLSNLGYDISNLFVFDNFPEPTKFSMNLGCFSHKEKFQLGFEWLTTDLTQNMELWLQDQFVDIDMHPFEERESDEQIDDFRSIIVDVPWDSYTSKWMPKYGKGFPGRYPVIISCNNLLAVDQSEPLAVFFEDQLRTTEVSFRVNKDVCDFGVVFSGDILDDLEAQKNVTNGIKDFLKQQSITAHLTVNHNPTSGSGYPIVIHWPFMEDLHD